jgi:MFS family permease
VVNGAGGPTRLITPVFATLLLATLLYFLSFSTIGPVLPRYVTGPLGAGNLAVGLAVGAFTVTAVVLRPVAGRIGDRRGRRILLTGGATIVMVSLLGLLLARSLAPVVGFRLLFGIGEAAFFVGAATSVTDLAPPARRGAAASLFALALYGGVAIGAVVGETTLDRFGFDAVWIVAGIAAGLAAVLTLRVPDTKPESSPGDPVPLVHRKALVPGAVLATSVFGLSAFMAFAPLYALSLGLGGVRFVLLLYAFVVLSIRSVGASIPDRLGPRRTSAVALVFSVGGLLLMAGWGTVPGLFVGAAVFGAGQALAFPALMTLAVTGIPPRERGAVVGTFSSFFDMAFGLGAVSMGAVAEVLGYRGAFAVASGAGVGGLTLLFVIRERGRRRAAVGAADVPGPG